MRGCNFCGAYFNRKTDEENLELVGNHMEKCTKENHYTDDPNIDGYVPVPSD